MACGSRCGFASRGPDDSARRAGGQPDRRPRLAARQGLSGSPAGGASQPRAGTCEVLNAGVSGDTAADGLARYDWAVPGDADALIVELGANDMLRGLSARGDEEGAVGNPGQSSRCSIADPHRRHAGGAQSGSATTPLRSTRSIRLWPTLTRPRSIHSSLTALRAFRSSTKRTECIRRPKGSKPSSNESSLRSRRSSNRSSRRRRRLHGSPLRPSPPLP